MLVHLPDGRRPEPFAAAQRTALLAVPADLRRTLTWDQGTEMGRHDLNADLFMEGIYFARPGQPWIRPVNENVNGLLAVPTAQQRPVHIHSRGPDRHRGTIERPTPQNPGLAHTSTGLRGPATVHLTSSVATSARNRAGTRPDQEGQSSTGVDRTHRRRRAAELRRLGARSR